uniref:Tetratricopeptide TPR_4 n=1 Tax=Geobacter sp. (strain M21) TaxID=443144 RepID=C6E8L8_GEOSM
MDWDQEVNAAETLLRCATIPSSEQIISAIKKVNPTRLCLPEDDRQRGYELKNRLQNLLLQHYGEAFQLIPHPCSPDVALIKHMFLSSIDACHTNLKTLSQQALDAVSDPEGSAAEAKGNKPKTSRKKIDLNHPAASPKDALKRAQQMLDGYDYAGAEKELAGMRLIVNSDLNAFSKGIRMLFEEMGAYQTAIDTLQAQPARVLQDKSIRELLALAYHGNGSLAEAGAVFDSMHPADLGKDALYAYSSLACRDGNHNFALRLVRMADEKPGFVGGLDALKIEIEKALSTEAEPLQDEAAAAFARGDLDRARTLALEALKSSKNLHKARRIVALAECLHLQAEISRLWQAVQQQTDRKARMRLLSKLQEIDSHNCGKIEEQLQAERDSERKEEITEHLAALQLALKQERWPDCFDEIMWLSCRGGADDEYQEAASLSPLLKVLYRNNRLERSSREAAKQTWLHYVEAIFLLRAGRRREALPILHQVHPFFRGCPEFRREHDEALAAEQLAASEDARRLVEESSAEGKSFSEVAELCAEMRKLLPLLHPDSRSAFAAAMDERLEELRPRMSQDVLTEQYRKARLMGNAPRALSLSGEITDPLAIEAIDAEIETMMKIEAEPLELSLSDSIEVDLRRVNSSLRFYWSTERHTCLQDDSETLILLDLKEMTAWRLKSPLFTGLLLVDYIVETHQFLFIEVEGNNNYRAVLDGDRSRFTSIFGVPAGPFKDMATSLEMLFMSETKECEYFVALSDSGVGDKIARFSINNVRNSLDTRSLASKVLGAKRVGTDSFVIVTEDELMLCSRTLALSTRVKLQVCILAVDRHNHTVYSLFEGGLMAHNLDLSSKEGFPEAISAGVFPKGALLGLNADTEIAFYRTKSEKGFFYNLRNNMLSSHVNLSSVISTAIPSAAWYYMEYDGEKASVRLKDITHSIGALLNWREVFFAGQPREEFLVPLEKLLDGVDVVQEMCDG